VVLHQREPLKSTSGRHGIGLALEVALKLAKHNVLGLSLSDPRGSRRVESATKGCLETPLGTFMSTKNPTIDST
jgi:hypothetical protein